MIGCRRTCLWLCCILPSVAGCVQRDAAKTEEPGRTESVPTQTLRPARPDHAPIAELAKGSNAFAATLYGRLSATPGNLIFSPVSISTAMSMVYAGAGDATATEIRDAMHYDLAPADLNRAFAAALHAWNDPDAADQQLRVVNRLFVEQRYAVKDTFLDLTGRYYAAPAEALALVGESDASRQRINGWVAEQTSGRITNLLGPGSLNDLSRLVIVNAVYFKGTWISEFDRTRTVSDATFSVGPATRVKVAMMDQRGDFQYAETNGARVIRLPYKGNRLSFWVVLPTKRFGLRQVEQNLTGESFESWRQAAQTREAHVQLPRFRLQPDTVALAEHLRALGIVSAFDRTRANLSGIADPSTSDPTDRLSIGAVMHKAFVEVNEEGTEAAAATAVAVMVAAAPDAELSPVDFIVDQPFLFFIRDYVSGTLLFLGRVTDPTRAG